MVTIDERKRAAALCRKFAMTGTFFGAGALAEVVDVRFPFNGTCWTKLANLIDPEPAEGQTCCDKAQTCDRGALLAPADEMFGKMRHSTKEEADAYDAMLKSKSAEIHPVDRDALLELAITFEDIAEAGVAVIFDRKKILGYANRIREAVGA